MVDARAQQEHDDTVRNGSEGPTDLPGLWQNGRPSSNLSIHESAREDTRVVKKTREQCDRLNTEVGASNLVRRVAKTGLFAAN